MIFKNIRADLARLTPDRQVNVRTFVRGILSQGFQAVMVYRIFRWFYERNLPVQPFRFFLERFVEITTGISIPARCDIGKGLRIHHFGGVIIHPSTRIGENCTLYHQVTIGDKGGSGGAATIGDNVLIGAGAKIIGEVTIADNCKIGANAVVTKDVAADSIVVGNPCRILPAKQTTSFPSTGVDEDSADIHAKQQH